MSLRGTFNSAAARYHRARPGYPADLFDDLITLTGLSRDARILEIGPGTGVATLPLAERGYQIHGVELGPELAGEARRNLAAFPRVRIDIGEFEAVCLASCSYDLVMSATSFHWVRQPIGFQRVAEVLRTGGYFAEFRHHHVWSPESDEFYRRSQEVYLRWDPETSPDHYLPLPEEAPTLESEIVASELFEPTVVRRYRQDVIHTPESYSDLLWTFSGHIAQPEPNRTKLIEGIADVIRGLPGGQATQSHLLILHVARKRD